MQARLVEPQLVLFLWIVGVAADEEYVEQVLPVVHIEALERCFAQRQRCGVALERSLLVGMAKHILQAVNFLA